MIGNFLYVTADNNLQKWTSAGETTLRDGGITKNVTTDANNNIWVTTFEDGTTHPGGATLQYSSDQGKTWQKPGGKTIGVLDMVGGEGSNCYIVDASNGIANVQTDGTVTVLFGANSALKLGYSPIETDPSNGMVWVLSPEVYIAPDNDWKNTGNCVQYFLPGDSPSLVQAYINQQYVAQRVAGASAETAVIVQQDGQIAYLSSTGPSPVSSSGLERCVALSSSGPGVGQPLIIVDQEAHESSTNTYDGGNSVNYYDTSSKSWVLPSPNTLYGALKVCQFMGG